MYGLSKEGTRWGWACCRQRGDLDLFRALVLMFLCLRERRRSHSLPPALLCCALSRAPPPVLRVPPALSVVGADGSFFTANFEKGGEATRVAYSQFVGAGAGQ